MDELEISGKRYISTRRAAKENKYHSDYIGQLIRGGKVIGQKVGRAWYVEVDSFNDYLGKENSVENIEPQEIKQAEQELPSAVLVEEEIIQNNSLAEEKSVEENREEDAHVITITRDTGHADKKHVPSKARAAGLRYYADDGPLFPRTQYSREPVFFAPQNAKVLEENPPASTHYSNTKPASRTSRTRNIFALAGVGALTLFCVAIASGALYSEVKVNNQTASTSYGFDFSYPASFIHSVK